MPIVPSYSPKRGNYLEDLRNRIELLEPSQSLSNIPVLNVRSPPTRSPQPMGVESIITPTQRLNRKPTTNSSYTTTTTNYTSTTTGSTTKMTATTTILITRTTNSNYQYHHLDFNPDLQVVYLINHFNSNHYLNHNQNQHFNLDFYPNILRWIFLNHQHGQSCQNQYHQHLHNQHLKLVVNPYTLDEHHNHLIHLLKDLVYHQLIGVK